MKSFIKGVLRGLGYDIQRIPPDSEPPTDEIISGPWIYHVLQMANQHYRPKVLRYHRTKYGEDHRVKYIAYFLDLRGLRILEVGPLEGHHSILLEKMGVRENIAIESRAENLQKCQRIKEKYALDHTRFLRHDLERLYNGEEIPAFQGPFDLVFCLGVLYHVPAPGKALEWFRSQSSSLFLGTHYADPSDPRPVGYAHNGKEYRARIYQEGGLADPLSGMSPTKLFLCEDDLIALIKDVGYSRVSVLGKDLQNGAPHITILAE